MPRDDGYAAGESGCDSECVNRMLERQRRCQVEIVRLRDVASIEQAGILHRQHHGQPGLASEVFAKSIPAYPGSSDHIPTFCVSF